MNTTTENPSSAHNDTGLSTNSALPLAKSENLQALRTLMQQVCGREMRTPYDFDHLAASIYSRLHESVSVSTLKRIYGYVRSDSTPRRAVLDILSRFVGYTDWAAFCRRDGLQHPCGSHPILGEAVSAEVLCPGDLITVLWQPDSECTFRCTGHHRFVVERSRGSKLSVGDTFAAHQFISGEPLYLENLSMQGSIPVTYVCGRTGGIRFSFPRE